MTAKRRLVPEAEIRSAIELARSYGIEIGGLDIRADGVTLLPKSESVEPGNAFAQWKNRGRTA